MKLIKLLQIQSVIEGRTIPSDMREQCNQTYFSESKAEVNGVFVGLPIDEDNDSDKTDERIDAWTKNLKEKFM